MIVIVASPFQLISAIISAEISSFVIKRIIVDDRNIDKIKFYEVCRLFGIKSCIISFHSISYSNYFLKFKELLSISYLCIYNNIIIGSDNNIYFKIFSLFCKSCCIVDDGTEVLCSEIFKENRHPFKKLIYTFLTNHKKIFYNSFFWDDNYRKKYIRVFNENIKFNNNIDENGAMLILSPFYEIGLINLNSYKKILLDCLSYLTKKESINYITIVAHPRSSKFIIKYSLNIIKSISMARIWFPTSTVEMSLHELDPLPGIVISFESTASIILELLYHRKLKHYCYQLPSNILIKYCDERLIVSNYFQNYFKGNIINL